MTVHEIAKLAGVSIGTVDRVLHKRGRVSQATKAKVEAIIKKYRFTPNPIARQLKRSRPYRFCALIPRRDQDAGYWRQIITGIERAAAEIKPLRVETEIIEFDRYDIEAFKTASQLIISEKPEGLVFAPIKPKRTRPFLDEISAQKIPFVFVDTNMPGTKPLCVIEQNPLSGGYLAGRLFHLFAGTALLDGIVSAPAAILIAHSEDYNLARRRDGFLRYAKKHGFPVIVLEYSDHQGLEISVKEIAAFLKKHPDLSGLFITNCMAHSAVKAAWKRKKQQPFLIVGYDLIPDNQDLLLNGRIDAIISQRPEEQGREALLTLFRSVVLGQAVEARMEMPLDVYIRENAPLATPTKL